MTYAAPVIVPIVEGPGDKAAAPLLLRRVLHERLGRFDFEVKQPQQAKNKGNLIKRLEDYLVYASGTPGCAAILVLLDADRDCPRELGAQLAFRARDSGSGIPIAVVCAKREYENWFLASDEAFTGEIEEFGGAENWLTRGMPTGRAYRETRDQAPYTQAIDIEAALDVSRSFRRLCSAIRELVDCIDSGTVSVTPCP